MGRELRSHRVRVCEAGDGSCQWFGRRSRQIVRSVGAASSPPGRLFLVRTSCCFSARRTNVAPLIRRRWGKLDLSKCFMPIAQFGKSCKCELGNAKYRRLIESCPPQNVLMRIFPTFFFSFFFFPYPDFSMRFR